FDLYGVMTPSPFGDLARHEEQLGLAPRTLVDPFNSKAWLDNVQNGHMSRDEFLADLIDRVRRQHAVDVDGRYVVAALDRSPQPRPRRRERGPGRLEGPGRHRRVHPVRRGPPSRCERLAMSRPHRPGPGGPSRPEG